MSNPPFENPPHHPPQRNLNSSFEISRDRLGQVFNTAIVQTRAELSRADASSDKSQREDLYQLMKTDALQFLLRAVHDLAHQKGISEVDAAREIALTFRNLDRIWTDYLIQEGFQRIRAPKA